MRHLTLVLTLPLRLEPVLDAVRRHAPSLMSLLRRGRALDVGDEGLSALCCEVLGVIRQQDWPVAPLTARADGLASSEGYWLRLDPAHLEVGMGGLMLRPADELGLSAAEAADLAASLAALGMELYTPVPTRWYLRLPAPPDLITTPLDRVAGEYLSAHLPQGRDAGRLMARVNEAQMLLHDHPANQDRERRGLAAVNGLWLWGGGELPRPAEQSVVVASDVGQVQVLARALGAKTRPTPGNAIDLDTDPSADWLVVLTPGENDASLEELLVRLERTWFHPLLVRLRFGRVRRLALHLMARPGQSVAVDAVAAWRFWR